MDCPFTDETAEIGDELISMVAVLAQQRDGLNRITIALARFFREQPAAALILHARAPGLHAALLRALVEAETPALGGGQKSCAGAEGAARGVSPAAQDQSPTAERTAAESSSAGASA